MPAAVAISSNSTTCQPGLDEDAHRQLPRRRRRGDPGPRGGRRVAEHVPGHQDRPELVGPPTRADAGMGGCGHHAQRGRSRRDRDAAAPGGPRPPAPSARMIDAFKSPLGRNGRPDEIAALLEYLLGPERAVLLRVGALLRRWHGRTVPGRRLAATLEAVMATHEELDAIEEIKSLKARYFRCMDTKDWDGFQAVFAPMRPWTPPRRRPISRSCTGARTSGSSSRDRSSPSSRCTTGTCPRSRSPRRPPRAGSGRCRTSCRCRKDHRSG